MMLHWCFKMTMLMAFIMLAQVTHAEEVSIMINAQIYPYTIDLFASSNPSAYYSLYDKLFKTYLVTQANTPPSNTEMKLMLEETQTILTAFVLNRGHETERLQLG